MGTDIHLHVEKFNDTTNRWEFVPPPEFIPCDWPHDADALKDGKFLSGRGKVPCWKCEGAGRYKPSSFYSDRNYDLFAILADVRNGFGFAGVKRNNGMTTVDEALRAGRVEVVRDGEDVVPIRSPKGFPDDLSPELKRLAEDEDGDLREEWYEERGWTDLGEHSFNWHLLRDLLDFDYTRRVDETGVVDAEEYAEWMKDKSKPPPGWAGDIAGGSVVHISNEEMERGITSGGLAGRGLMYVTRVNWGRTYREVIGEHWFNVMETLKQIGDPSKVRLVFGFDS